MHPRYAAKDVSSTLGDICLFVLPHSSFIHRSLHLAINFPRHKKSKYIPAHAKYLAGLKVKYDSIAHLWNEWYREYANTTEFPRLIVRMEDILFRAEEVVPTICHCFGGTMSNSLGPNELRYYSDVANQNPGVDNVKGSGLLRSIMTYGNKTLRRQSYQAVQFEAAKEVLDPSLMKLFGYSYEEP